MTTRPQLHRESNKLVGVLAVALFAVFAAVFITSGFGTAAGFETGAITTSIGYAMFNLDAGAIDSEGFLVSFILVALVLDAALDGSIMLAKEDEEADY